MGWSCGKMGDDKLRKRAESGKWRGNGGEEPRLR